MDSYKIFKQADDLVRQCGIRKPKLIVKELGIDLYDGEDLGDLLGMYTFRWNHRLMFINSKVSDRLKDMVIAHELGHDQQHRSIAKAGKALQEFSLFSMKDNTEYEANAFASHILLDNDEVYSLAKEGYDIFTLSQMIGSDVNLLLIKMQEMNKLGYDFTVPLEHDSRFFRNIKGRSLPEYE